MLENMKFKSTNGSGSLAAAYLISITGLVGVTLATGLAFHRTPDVPLYVFGIGGGLVLLTLIAHLRPELPSSGLWLFSRGRSAPDPHYVPRLIKSAPTAFGTNLPPTIEELRDLKDTARNWVPSKARSGRQSLRRRA